MQGGLHHSVEHADLHLAGESLLGIQPSRIGPAGLSFLLKLSESQQSRDPEKYAHRPLHMLESFWQSSARALHNPAIS